MSNSFRLKLSGRSKSRKKESKYIPAAIIPSVAFIANPTRPTSHNPNNKNSNNLLNSTLSSSLVGLSEEFRKHQNNESNNIVSRSHSLDGRELNHDYDLPEPSIEHNLTAPKRKERKIKLGSANDSKRHIDIANGLNIEPDNNANRNLSGLTDTGGYYAYREDDPISNKKVPYPNPSVNIGFSNIETEADNTNKMYGKVMRNKVEKDLTKELRADGKSYTDFGNGQGSFSIEFEDTYDEPIEKGAIIMRNKVEEDLTKELRADGKSYTDIGNGRGRVSIEFEDTYDEPVEKGAIRNGRGRVSIGFEDTYDEPIGKGAISGYESVTNPQTNEPYIMMPLQFSQPTHPANESAGSADGSAYSVPKRNVRIGANKHEGENQNMKQLKDEISALKGINYRLNMKIGDLLPMQESGRSIGKSVFPGKGPVPSWIMNTKYLAPLLAVYDRKFNQQNAALEKMKESMLKFEKEIRHIMDENKQLYSQLQENKKTGPTSHNEWMIIIDQTKLVIEENHLLLQELDIQQQRNKDLENRYIGEVSQLKTNLATVSSERDISNEEITRLMSKNSELKVRVNSTNTNDATTSEINSLKYQIDDLLRHKKSLEADLSDIRNKDKRMEKKIEKLKAVVKSEKEFRQYLNDVIDKGNEISSERNVLAEKMTLQDSEIRRITNRLVKDVKFHLDIEINGSMTDVCARKKDEIATDELYHLEAWISTLLQCAEDLNNRCRHQEKDVHYYQNLLKEKDKSLQESEKQNEQLESQVDLLWKNAKKDS